MLSGSKSIGASCGNEARADHHKPLVPKYQGQPQVVTVVKFADFRIFEQNDSEYDRHNQKQGMKMQRTFKITLK